LDLLSIHRYDSSMHADPTPFRTSRLRLVPATARLARSAVADKALFGSLLQAQIPSDWPPELLADAEAHFAEVLEGSPASAGWWSWYIIDEASSTLIGSAGYGGEPSETGVVQIGYALLEEWHGRGLGSEAVGALIDWAFKDPRVKAVAAETFPHLKPSLRVMEKVGMKFEGPGAEVGTVRYRVERP
jgi:[ribosomal protein S5]-alanine N-acetyltransferase